MKRIATISWEPGKAKMEIKDALFVFDNVFFEAEPGVYHVMEKDQPHFRTWRGQGNAVKTVIPRKVRKELGIEENMAFKYNKLGDTIYISLVKHHKAFWRLDNKGDFVSKKTYVFDDIFQLLGMDVTEGSYLVNINNFTFKKNDVWKI